MTKKNLESIDVTMKLCVKNVKVRPTSEQKGISKEY